MTKQFPWKRFWCRREASYSLADRGFLADPEGKHGTILNPELTTLDQLQTMSCLALLGEPGVGKSWSLSADVDAFLKEKPDLEVIRLDLRSFGSEDRLYRALFEHPAFLRWANGDNELHVYLDSFDECLLRIDTVAALLADELPKYPLQRLKLRIACRTAAWAPILERALRAGYGEDIYSSPPAEVASRERFTHNRGWTTVIDGRESRAEDLSIIPPGETMATIAVEDDGTFRPNPRNDNDLETQLKQDVDNVYSAIQNSILSCNAVLYRNENWSAHEAKAFFKTGSIVRRAGFVSTSKSPNVWPGNLRLTIDAPKGTHAIDVHSHNLTEQPIEKEVIVQHNLAYKVLSVDEAPGIVLNIHLRIVPVGEGIVAKSVEDDMEPFLPLPNDTSDEKMWTNPETGEWEWSPINFDSPRAAENSREKFTENGGWSKVAD